LSPLARLPAGVVLSADSQQTHSVVVKRDSLHVVNNGLNATGKELLVAFVIRDNPATISRVTFCFPSVNRVVRVVGQLDSFHRFVSGSSSASLNRSHGCILASALEVSRGEKKDFFLLRFRLENA
jgi:hypothetical protein